MKILKKLLQSNLTYFFLFIFLFLYVVFFTKIIKYESNYGDGPLTIRGKVIKYSVSEEKISFIIMAQEKIQVIYYWQNDEKWVNSFQIGSEVVVKGTLSTPKRNSIPNTFNYQKYLYTNNIYKIMQAESIQIEGKKIDLLSFVKNWIYRRAQANDYLKLFVVGDKSSLDSEVYNSFKNCGVAHLLAVSGMHVSIFVAILEHLLKYVNKTNRSVFIAIFLIFYAYVVNFSASILRVVIFFILNLFNKRLGLKLCNKKILFLTAFVMLLANPFFVYQIGFIYSFITVLSLFIIKKYLKGNYFLDIIIISFWALLFTLPITVNINYEINLLTFLSNLVLIPLVTYFLYPFALICFVLPFLLPVFVFFINIMESFVLFIGSFSGLLINIPRLNIVFIVVYYLLLFLEVHYNLKIYLVLSILIILFTKISVRLDNNYYLHFFDVGQGDSCLLISPYHKEVVLIDTGGIISYNKKSKYFVSDNIILYLKSIGITKVKTLLLTHGDYDHMGEAINLVENFNVEKVIFNCGEFNELEQDLIKVLGKKKIPYYSCIKELNIDDNKLYFLNNKDYGNENDNSSVIYTELNNHKFLFMGDAGVEVEEDLIEKYNLKDIDVLKVGHHGSKTSSSKSFIDEIDPEYSIISVGKNNRYGHPNNSVLDNLDDSKIYRTDQDGSIMFEINKDKLKIETCSP
ncbi:MAG: DNA internalization-related competence protein ComEC/Rec2 [Firmicutes bacterium]|nr:DNA internalization-related competence protein ComEC/Rec2 [Bacillota bacterium]